MTLRNIKVSVLLFSMFLLTRVDSIAQPEIKESHILVSLRMIGHQVLLYSGDSTSRVLPIEKEGERYKIQFSSEFKFDPDEIVKVIDHVVNNSGIAENYIVEIEKCQTNDIVYSYEIVSSGQSNIIPCKGRIQPLGCYVLFFTILEKEERQRLANVDSNTSLLLENEGDGFSKITIFSMLLIMFTGGTIYFKITKNKKKRELNYVSIGEYQFDTRSMKLSYRGEVIELTTKESDLLLLLYTYVNSTIEKERILNEVWGDEGDYVGRTLDVFISRLRKKLESDTSLKIVNVRGVGYKLVLNK